MTRDATSHTASHHSLSARALALATAVALVLAACGQTASITLTVNAPTVDLIRGDEVNIPLTLVRSGGASTAVALAVTGLPPNVSASFTPATLTAGASTSILTLTAAAAALEARVDITISATATALAASAAVELNVTSLSVTGAIRDVFGGGAPGVTVMSQGDVDITDANGEFTLTGLSVPYQVVSYSLLGDPWYHVFEGLSEAEPVLVPVGGVTPAGTTRSATLSGALVGGAIPVAGNQIVLVCVEGLDGVAVTSCERATAGAVGYSRVVQWQGPLTRQVRVHAIQYQFDAEERPVAYLGYGTAEVTLTEGGASGGDVDLGTTLAATTVEFTVNTGIGPLQQVIITMTLPTGFTMAVFRDISGDASYALQVPSLPGAAIGIMAQAGPALRMLSVGSAAAAGATLLVPYTANHLAPLGGATGITNATNFVIDDAVGGELTYLWREMKPSPLSFGLTTKRTSVAIPDGSGAGLPLPASTSMSWSVYESSTAGSAQVGHGLASYGDNYLVALLGATATALPDGSLTTSTTQIFTTAP